MALTLSTEIARSSLKTLQERAAVVSRNIANANNDFASRKIANTVSIPGAGVRMAAITRATDNALFQNVLVANASVGGQEAVVSALDQLNTTILDPEQDASPAARLGQLVQSLQQYSSGPQDPIRARAVLDSATDLATSLNDATDTVQGVRSRADADIANSVETVNTLLSQVEVLNGQIVNGTFAGADVTDQLDQRDQLLAQISNQMGIRVVHRADNDIAVYTDSGVTLFDQAARAVTFEPTPVYGAATTGNAVFVDGVAITGPASTMPLGSGRLKGLTDIRDNIAVTYQNQLDEVARGLIEAFAERDQTASGLPDAAGIFTYSGAPAVPATGTIVPGLAGDIEVNAAVDPRRGGNLDLIRDGGINGASYDYNPSGAAGFTGRILELSDNLTVNRAFDSAAEAGSFDSVVDFASSSVGWLQDLRQSAAVDLEFNQTVQERSTDALNSAVGVNLDFELSLLLEIEKSYQATSRLIATIDNMFEAILQVA